MALADMLEISFKCSLLYKSPSFMCVCVCVCVCANSMLLSSEQYSVHLSWTLVLCFVLAKQSLGDMRM